MPEFQPPLYKACPATGMLSTLAALVCLFQLSTGIDEGLQPLALAIVCAQPKRARIAAIP